MFEVSNQGESLKMGNQLAWADSFCNKKSNLTDDTVSKPWLEKTALMPCLYPVLWPSTYRAYILKRKLNWEGIEKVTVRFPSLLARAPCHSQKGHQNYRKSEARWLPRVRLVQTLLFDSLHLLKPFHEGSITVSQQHRCTQIAPLRGKGKKNGRN